jgi:hypothetical protein
MLATLERDIRVERRVHHNRQHPLITCHWLQVAIACVTSPTGGKMAMPSDEKRLRALAERLRGEVTEMQERWEALGEELEAKRRGLRIVEGTLELLQQRHDTAQAQEGGSAIKGLRSAAPDAEGADGKGVLGALSREQASGGDAGLHNIAMVTRHVPSPTCQVPGERSPGLAACTEDVDVPPRLNLATALPLSVWQDHLVPMLFPEPAVRLMGPMLFPEAAARLKVVCKALRGWINQCPVKLGEVAVREELSAVLTTFPATESMIMTQYEPLEAEEEATMIALLGEHGGTLKCIKEFSTGAERLLSRAVGAGALPNLSYFRLELWKPDHRRLLLDGRLDRVEEMDVGVGGNRGLDDEEQRDALAHLQRLPRLRTLLWRYHHNMMGQAGLPAPQAACPPFIPRTLKSLTLSNVWVTGLDVILRDMSGWLEGSGARLEEIIVQPMGPLTAEGGAALARILRSSSSTLKKVVVGRQDCECECLISVEFLLALAPGLASCYHTAEQQLLGVPPESIQGVLESPSRASFRRLTHLMLEPNDEALDLTSPLWDLVAGGLCPALTSLSLVCDLDFGFVWAHHASGGGEEGACRLLRALDGLGGTLTRFEMTDRSSEAPNPSPDPPYAVCYDLGVAIGKLRRLKDLSLSIAQNGRAYHAVARGLVAWDGCPELLRVSLGESGGVRRSLAWLTYEPSLILPSVRRLNFKFEGLTDEEELLLWCGLVRMPRKHLLEARVLTLEEGRPSVDLAWLRQTLLLGDVLNARFERPASHYCRVSLVWGGE